MVDIAVGRRRNRDEDRAAGAEFRPADCEEIGRRRMDHDVQERLTVEQVVGARRVRCQRPEDQQEQEECCQIGIRTPGTRQRVSW